MERKGPFTRSIYSFLQHLFELGFQCLVFEVRAFPAGAAFFFFLGFGCCPSPETPRPNG